MFIDALSQLPDDEDMVFLMESIIRSADQQLATLDLLFPDDAPKS